jgi:hypothetical protein
MRRIRFSIAGLLGLVLFVAVALAALRDANDLWDSGVFSFTLGLLLVSILLAIHRTERRRAYWLGFALFGGGYLVASLIPPVESRLLTTKGLTYLDSKVPGRETTLGLSVRWFSKNPNPVVGYVFSADWQTAATNPQGTIRLWNPSTGRLLAGPSATSENFVRIGHSLLALIMAFGGGHLSRCLLQRERRQRAGEPGVSTVPAPVAGAP